jgi:threonyl-tRNA synthetase
MPDCHALVADLDQAKDEFLTRFKLSMGILEKGLELSKDSDFELAIRVTKDFYEENKDFVLSMVKLFGKPVLLEMWEERFFYFVLKWEFNFVDNLNKASALSTDQIDIENAKHYDMTYVDENGEKQYPLVLHCSPSGGLERDVYAMLEKAHRDSLKGTSPILPLWLAPTQVRIVPVSEKFMDHCEELLKQIQDRNIRVDIDDRPLSLGKKIRAAEKEWVNYVIVIGDNEINSEVLPVRDRKAGKQIRNLKLQELTDEINQKTAGMPFKPLTLPKLLSKRPQFAF